MEQRLPEMLKQDREARGLTQEDVSNRLKVSPKTVSAWETGRRNCRVTHLLQLAQLYGARPSVYISAVRDGFAVVEGTYNLLEDYLTRYSVEVQDFLLSEESGEYIIAVKEFADDGCSAGLLRDMRQLLRRAAHEFAGRESEVRC